MAPPSLLDIYRQFCLKFILSGLQSVAGKSKLLVTDLAQYQNQVVFPIWNTLPLPIRLMGRPKLRWDEFFTNLRPEVFLAPEGRVALRPDTSQRLVALVNRMFGGPAAATPAAPAVPMAMPVQPAAPLVAQPVQPVRPTPARAPAQAPKPKPVQPAPAAPQSESDTAVGIDLGTTYSVVAYLDAHGRPVSIPNATGEIITPSVVLFDDAGPVVGKEAVQASAMEPEKIAECVKRDMGSKYYRKKMGGEFVPPEVISSIILKSLKADAERKLGPVRNAVITVPAYFDESRRRATIDSGRLAGLDVLDIINEPTAAAIAYGYQLGFLDPTGKSKSDKPLRVLVYDLGGGTFDVTIVEILGTSFRAVATDGDVALGGKDWDDKLIELAAEQFVHQHREDPRTNPVSLQEMWLAAETCKKTLTERPKAAMFINHLGTRMKVEVTREQFEDATAALLGRTRTTTEIVVRQAGLNWAAIDKVLLVGGSTRMPQVTHMLQDLTGKAPERSVSVDEAVAHGAALYASLVMSKRKPSAAAPRFSVTNINSHSLGIVGTDPSTGRKKNQILIPKNTPLPTAVTKTFKTQRQGQQNVVIRVVEGESERPEACIQVGTCTIGGFPANLPAGSPVTVSYAYHADGRLDVSGQVQGMAQPATTSFQRENTMDDADMQLWSQYVNAAEIV